MLKSLWGFVKSAFTNQAQREQDTRQRGTLPFDLNRYEPRFTAEDEQLARDEGLFTAHERWKWIMNNKLTDYGREKVKRNAKAQTTLDLESTGLSFDALSELSESALNLPRDPDHEARREVRPPKDPL